MSGINFNIGSLDCDDTDEELQAQIADSLIKHRSQIADSLIKHRSQIA